MSVRVKVLGLSAVALAAAFTLTACDGGAAVSMGTESTFTQPDDSKIAMTITSADEITAEELEAEGYGGQTDPVYAVRGTVQLSDGASDAQTPWMSLELMSKDTHYETTGGATNVGDCTIADDAVEQFQAGEKVEFCIPLIGDASDDVTSVVYWKSVDGTWAARWNM